VFVYRALEHSETETTARAFEGRFKEDGWPPQWRDTHHHHSTAHQALGISADEAMLELGDPNGRGSRCGPATRSSCPSVPAIG